MKFNPLSKEIYTDQGKLIKKMNCPYEIKWDVLEVGDSSASRNCSICNQAILDTSNLSDQELLDITNQNPDTCLKIDLNQSNLQLIRNGLIQHQ